MTKIIGVRFRNNGRVYYFDPGLLDIKEGDSVIVETAHGIEMGFVSRGVSEVEDSEIVAPLVPVLRIATEEDEQMRQMYMAKEDDAFTVCAQKIEQHKLDMKLVRVEYAFNGSKLVFYFTADERVDFRDLVKDLAFQFRTRIELRQIGVRDEAKMLGGLGPCGRPICCKQFLDDFSPVSIKMAKEQNLSLSPTKISGLCGRLMCCLQYEESSYEEMKKLMPRVGKDTVTPDGIGTVLENNAITELTKVKIQLPDGTFDQRWYHYSFLRKPGDCQVSPENGEPAAEVAAATVTAVKTDEKLNQPEPGSTQAATVRPERRQRRNGPKKPITSFLGEEDSSASGSAPTGENPESGSSGNKDAGKRRKPQRPSQRREKNDSRSVESRDSSDIAEKAQKAESAEGQNAEAAKRRRHRGGRKHRPHSETENANGSTPDNE